MKKLIAAITVSFMMLGLMTGCGEVKSFDGDILDVISFDMSKKEILENAEKEFGEIDGMGGRDKELVEEPMDAKYIEYRLDAIYGYQGQILLTFDWNLRTLEQIGIFYDGIEGDYMEQFENICSQFTDMYGELRRDEVLEDKYEVYKQDDKIELRYTLYSNALPSISIYFAPKEVLSVS